eukprot:9898505-Lingulodinium_polyedra.AAC.1
MVCQHRYARGGYDGPRLPRVVRAPVRIVGKRPPVAAPHGVRFVAVQVFFGDGLAGRAGSSGAPPA